MTEPLGCNHWLGQPRCEVCGMGLNVLQSHGDAVKTIHILHAQMDDLIVVAEQARDLLLRLRARGTIGDAPEIRLLSQQINKWKGL